MIAKSRDQLPASPRPGALAWPRLGYAALVVLLALAALALRAWTIRASLPYVDHPDEPNPIDYVVRMLQTGDPNPHAFQKPSLYVYLLLAVLTAHYRWGLAAGAYGPLDRMTITTHLYTTIPGFFVWGRLLTAALAALTVVFAYRVGARVWNRLAGVVAALFLALSPFHMRHSQYVTTDVTSAMLVLLAFGAAVAVARRGRWRDYAAAGAFAGLAASTKYNAGVAAAMVVAAHALFWLSPGVAAAGGRRLLVSLRELPRLFLAGAAALLGFVAGTPYALLSWNEFRGGLLGQVKDYGETAHGDFTGAWNWRGYLDFFTGDELGWLVCAAVLAGLALMLWPKRSGEGRGARAAAIIWLSFTLPYLLLHVAQASHFNRNMLPLVVLAAVPLGVAVAGVAARVEGFRQKERGIRALTFYLVPAALAALLLLPSILQTWSYVARQRRGDTRLQAQAWMIANIPPGVRVAAEMRALPGPLESPWAEVADLPGRDLAWYRRQGYAYVVASSESWKQWAIPQSYRDFAGQPVAEFGGADPRAMFGPHLAIYATGLAAADVPRPVAGQARVGGATLLGMSLGRPDARAPGIGVAPATRFKAGETIGLRTFWSVGQSFGQDYFVFVHMVDAAGKTVAQRDTPPWQGRFPTSSWRAGAIVVDVNDLVLPAGLPPGSYTLRAGMFDPATGGHPPMTLDGQPVDAIPLGEIVVS